MTNDEDSEPELEKQKEVAFYSALVDAWITTQFEKDKSLLYLSSGGIGILVTLMTTIGVSSFCELVFFAIGLFAFILSVLGVLIIFGYNAKYIEALISEKK